MDFSWALSALKAGLKVTRSHWKTGFLWCKPAARVQSDWCKDPVLKQLAEQEGGIPATSTISACFKDFNDAWTVTTGWVPQQFDLFADDWTTWHTEEQDSIDKLPKAGSMANCDKLSNSINQLLDTVTCLPSLNAYVESGPNDKELTITIREEGPTAVSASVQVGCTFHVTHHNTAADNVSNPDGITKSSIGSDALNDKVED